MTTILPSLLCLGSLPKPTIWAEPDSRIMLGQSVTIWCQGSLEAEEYHLYKGGITEPWDRQCPLEPRNKAKFFIQYMTPDYAGQYHCYYLSHTQSAVHSDPLDLMFIGAYMRPTLSVLSSFMDSSGGNVTLQCVSQLGSSMFILYKEREHRQLGRLVSQQRSSGLFQDSFFVDPSIPNNTLTFRCYSFFENNPYLLSSPSDSLELPVSGLKRYLHVLIEVSVLLVLLVLVVLIRHWHWRKHRESDANVTDFHSRAVEQLDNQAVVYAQVCRLLPKQETTTSPSSQLREPPAKPVTYAVLNSY
ncbi:PREDICTED: leukocyte immunoglobulin-like receptor subfamily A member 6-like [Chrysochloris asiatica]|uniref:Leukocyte immunoglobulin-like receptor subfamily A member 6-like n=1 Tax=Chrysochloris asiatica TaxID=185453 RepID=A0A9B0TXA4_CHRAS|nr:PREDICTED: leukocyte immunoglobulin-like receptor subfamily A member 6-like [Chrysochloris asiatica]